MGLPEIFDLQSLAEASGTEPRTIRSYIEKGLLPGAETRGRNATYGADHLARLKVIGLLRDARRQITLDEVRLLLLRLSPQQVRDIASGRLQIAGLVDTNDPAPARSALEYLNSIPREGESRPRHKLADPAYAPASPGPIQDSPPLEQLLRLLMHMAGSSAVPRWVHGETWVRIAITPDIELSVRGEFSAEQIAQLHRIGDHLRHLLTKGG